MTCRPSSIFVRIAYAFALILFVLPVVSQIRYAQLLFSQMSSNPNVVNPVTAVSIVLLCLVTSAVVLYRVGGLLIGKFKLEVFSSSGPIYWLRLISVTFLLLGFFIFVATILGRFITGISAVMLIAGEFRLLMPTGLILFEFSRLLEREVFSASTT